MEMATTGIWEIILKIIISFIALFTPSPAPLAPRVKGGHFVITGRQPNAAMLGFLENGCP